VKRTDDVTVTGSGDWWTAWCRAGGLHTQNVGSEAFMTQGYSTSVTFSGDISIGTPKLADAIDAKLGFSVTDSKSIGAGEGCVNTDGQPHNVWFQEHMGWAQLSTHTTIVFSGGSW
jgi:hypothetical protein